MTLSRSAPFRVGLALLVLGIAVARAIFFDSLSQRLDTVTLALLLTALLIVLVPWEGVTKVNVAGVEVTLASPQVKGALAAAPLDRVGNDRLHAWLTDHESDVQVVPGARVLWIDDTPNVVLGERRIMRALGVEIVPASSTEAATSMLRDDADFDLIITDVRRPGGTSYLDTGFLHDAEGTNFIIRIRTGLVPELAGIAAIRQLPVIIYAAFTREGLAHFTAPLRALEPEPDVTNQVETLVETAILRLAESRSKPIAIPTKKTPT